MVVFDIFVGKRLKEVVGYPEASFMREVAVITKGDDGQTKIIGESYHLRTLLAQHPEAKEMKITEARTYLNQLVFQVKEAEDEG